MRDINARPRQPRRGTTLATLAVLALGIPQLGAHAQPQGAQPCAQLDLQFAPLSGDVIAADPHAEPSRLLSDAHKAQLAEAFVQCGGGGNIFATGEVSDASQPADSFVLHRQIAAARLADFRRWALGQGLDEQYFEFRTTGSQEPEANRISVALFSLDGVTRTAGVPSASVQLRQLVEAGEVGAAPPPPPPAAQTALGIPPDPCTVPFVATFGVGHELNAQRDAFNAYFDDCAADTSGPLAITTRFDDASITAYADWVSWNVFVSARLRGRALAR